MQDPFKMRSPVLVLTYLCGWLAITLATSVAHADESVVPPPTIGTLRLARLDTRIDLRVDGTPVRLFNGGATISCGRHSIDGAPVDVPCGGELVVPPPAPTEATNDKILALGVIALTLGGVYSTIIWGHSIVADCSGGGPIGLSSNECETVLLTSFPIFAASLVVGIPLVLLGGKRRPVSPTTANSSPFALTF